SAARLGIESAPFRQTQSKVTRCGIARWHHDAGCASRPVRSMAHVARYQAHPLDAGAGDRLRTCPGRSSAGLAEVGDASASTDRETAGRESRALGPTGGL